MKKILLIVSGGIAAYRSLDLIREIKRRGDDVTCVLTKSATKFVQPLSFASLSQNKVYTDLFDIENESKIGHIKLSRDADLIVLAPATANILAKMVHGISDSLATSILLANNKPLLIAPSMNVKMWNNPATIENIKSLKIDTNKIKKIKKSYFQELIISFKTSNIIYGKITYSNNTKKKNRNLIVHGEKGKIIYDGYSQKNNYILTKKIIKSTNFKNTPMQIILNKLHKYSKKNNLYSDLYISLKIQKILSKINKMI